MGEQIIRQYKRLGEPSGSNRFMRPLEKLLDRPLEPQKTGAKKESKWK